MAHISRHGDKWRAQVAKGGVRKTKVTDTKAEAKLWAAQLEASISAGLHDSGKTFAQAVERYISEVTKNKRGKRWETLRLNLLLKSPEFAGTLAGIEAPQIAQWRDRRLQTVKASTVLREANILRNLFTVARDEWRWVSHNPFKGVRLPKDEAPRDAVWGWREIRRVIRAGQRSGSKTSEVVDAFHISLRTAMRLSESLISPTCFDARRQVVVLPMSKTQKRAEVVPVGRIAAKLIAREPFKVNPNEASTLFRKLTKSMLIYGLTFHDTRATALKHLSRKVDVMTLAKISRHKDLKILLNTYYRVTPEEIARRI